jgi:glyoxylase-like metal-dependent hydrolase (beta-lactamase superfamily II)
MTEIAGNMNIETVVVGAYEVNCYVVWDQGRNALVIDPGANPERIEKVIQANRLKVVAFLITHGHADHIGALPELHSSHPAPVALSAEDARWAFLPINQLLPHYPALTSPPKVERVLADGQKWTDGELRYEVIATPGHSPGGVCYYFPDAHALFAGDTLFQGSVGRTDIPGGDPRTLSDSLKKLKILPDDTRVFSGHGPETTIEIEKQTNFFMRRSGRD